MNKLKTLLIALVSVLCLAFAGFALASCDFLFGNNSGDVNCEHEWSDWIVFKEPSCTATGERKHVCTKCGRTETKDVSPTGHSFNKDNECTLCGYVLEATVGLEYGSYYDEYGNYVGHAVTGIGMAVERDIVIPTYHEGSTVTVIADRAFSGKDAIKSVYIPDTVKIIGSNAFYYCTSLKQISFSENTTKIGARACYGCSALSEINLPQSGVLIGANAFTETSYYEDSKNWSDGALYMGKHLIATNENLPTSYTVKEDTLSIANGAFAGRNKLIEITISNDPETANPSLLDSPLIKANVPVDCIEYLPSSVTDLTLSSGLLGGGNWDKDTFSHLKNLTHLNVSEKVSWWWRSQENVFYNLGKLQSLTLASIPDQIGTLFGTTEYEGSVAVEQYGKSNGRSITYYLPASLNKIFVMGGAIGDNCFYGCHILTDIVLGDAVTSIGKNAFTACTGLTSINIPNGVKTIAGGREDRGSITRFFGSFAGSSLTTIYLSESINSIGEWAFWNCPNLTDIIVNEDNPVYSSQEGVLFNKEKNEIVHYPAGKTNKSYTIFNNITSIAKGAFASKNNLEEIHITDIVAWCNISFRDESSNPLNQGANLYLSGELVTDLIIPNSVTSIGDYAFKGCSSLTSINIPDSVTSIGDYAFDDCKSLTSIAANENNPNYSSQDGVLYNKVKTEFICIPRALKGDITIPDSVTSIGDYAFHGCSLTSITIPDSVASIGNYAFDDCESLTSVTFAENSQLTSISSHAFSHCSSLTSITIPDGVIYIGWGAFESCGLTNIIIPNSVTSIGASAFSWCQRLESIVIPSGVQFMDIGVFSDCRRLKDIYCEASKQPDNWDEEWTVFLNSISQFTIHWGDTWEYVDGVPTVKL